MNLSIAVRTATGSKRPHACLERPLKVGAAQGKRAAEIIHNHPRAKTSTQTRHSCMIEPPEGPGAGMEPEGHAVNRQRRNRFAQQHVCKNSKSQKFGPGSHNLISLPLGHQTLPLILMNVLRSAWH